MQSIYPESSNTLVKSSINYSKIFLITSLVLLIISTGAGCYYLGYNHYFQSSKDEMFSSQTATIKGRIIKTTPSSIEIQTEKGKIASFELSKSFKIIKRPSSESPSSAKTQEIEINKNTLLFLEKSSGAYKVKTIAYL